MSHFVKVDNNGFVTESIEVTQQEINTGNFGDVFRWIQTSDDGSYRKNAASIGFSYDRIRDAFIPPDRFASWTLNEATCKWESPVAEPTDGGAYEWDETVTNWVVKDITNTLTS